MKQVPVSYVLYVASFSGLSIFDCPFGILLRLFVRFESTIYQLKSIYVC